MIRTDADLTIGDAVIKVWLARCFQYGEDAYQLYIIDKSETYGISSPVIRSTEEAKYQRGTQIYTTDRINDKIDRQAALEREMKYLAHDVTKYAKIFIELSDTEQRLLIYYYEQAYTYDQIGFMLGYTSQSVQYKLDSIRRKFI